MAGPSLTSVRRVARRAVPVGVLTAITVSGVASAHGPVPAEPPSAANLLFGWTIEPAVFLALVAAAVVWVRLVRQVNRAHPANPVPRRRTVCFLLGLAAVAVALMSGIDTYDTTLFSIHMVQHLLLTLLAAPLIVLGAPITLLLRASTPHVRHRVILPILHSRVLRAITFPVVTWVLFAATMWWTHFSAIFNASLENPAIHDLEHALYLTVGLLFWWPAIGLDPSPWRMSHP
ncbi:MAG TPA: cytochrome c oxidase assembly protein, partial [Candidatus Limnocylindrales bacterium]